LGPRESSGALYSSARYGRGVKERRIHQVFRASVLIKGANAVLECIGGAAFALARSDNVAASIAIFAQRYLVEGVHGFAASHAISWVHGVSPSTQHFIAFYLLSHGIIKLVVVIGLLRERRWAYPLALITIAAFIVYQLYHYSYTHGTGLLLLTAFDLFLIWLVWHEYQLVRRNLPTH